MSRKGWILRDTYFRVSSRSEESADKKPFCHCFCDSHLKLNLAKEIKDNKKSFFEYVSSKMITSDCVGLLLNEVYVLVAGNTEKAEILNVLFALVFTTKTAPQQSQDLKVRVWGTEYFPLV